MASYTASIVGDLAQGRSHVSHAFKVLDKSKFCPTVLMEFWLEVTFKMLLKLIVIVIARTPCFLVSI